MWDSLPPPFFKGFEDSRGQEMCTLRANPPIALLLSCVTLEILSLDNSDLIFRIYMFFPKPVIQEELNNPVCGQ